MLKKKLKKPSQEFENAITHTGSIIIDCELCGITHVGNDEHALKEGLGETEYIHLTKDMKKNPEKYIHHSETDYASWGTIDGKQAVIGCPCNKLSVYEDFFWDSRHIISEYFTSRTTKELEEAKTNMDLARKVKSAIK